MKYTKEHLKRLVAEIRESDVELSGWEAGFLESLAEKLSKGWTLSERQLKVLDRLYREKTLQ